MNNEWREKKAFRDLWLNEFNVADLRKLREKVKIAEESGEKTLFIKKRTLSLREAKSILPYLEKNIINILYR